MLPVITIGGLLFIGLLTGVVVTETIYHLHGLGRLFVISAAAFDVVTLLGLVLFSSIVMVGGNLLVDVLYGFFDPRVRLS